jgi:hypothetical protein
MIARETPLIKAGSNRRPRGAANTTPTPTRWAQIAMSIRMTSKPSSGSESSPFVARRAAAAQNPTKPPPASANDSRRANDFGRRSAPADATSLSGGAYGLPVSV